MSVSFEGCHIFMKALIDQRPWLVDPSLLPMPWKYPPSRESYLVKPDGRRKLKIGILWSDGVVKPHPPVLRALKELTTKLQQSAPGEVEFVDWKPYRHDVAWDIISSLYFVDGAKQDREAIALSGEPWRPLSDFIIKDQPNVREYSISEVWDLTIRREEYRAAYAKVWNDAAADDSHSDIPVDVILCPVGPGAAPPLNHSKYWGYTSQWNLLDYPALVFPVTQVDATKDDDGVFATDDSYTPLNTQDEWNRKLYASAATYADAPVSLQLVARRYEDEKLFEAMQFIRDKVGPLPFEPFR